MKKLFKVGLFTLLGIAIYFPSLKGDFILDDYTSIVKNVYIRTLSDPSTLFSFAPSRFVSYFTFAINYQMGKLDTFSYHITNTFFHIITSLLVFVFVRELVRNKKSLIPLTVSFLFLVHPVQTQAVSYITQRMASMSAMFYIMAIILFIRSRLKFNISYIAAIVTALISLFSKEISYTIPITILVTCIFFLKEKYSWKRICFAITPIFVLFVAVFTAVSFTPRLASATISAPDPSHINPLRVPYLLTQINAVSGYIFMLIVPKGQSLDHDFAIRSTFFELPTLVSLTALVFLLAIAFIFRKRHKVITFGILFFFITLSLESVVPLEDVFVEHRLYLPSFGLFLVYGYALIHFLTRFLKISLVNFLVILHLAVLTIATFSRNVVWSSEEKIWTEAVALAPGKVRPHANLGVVYKLKKDTANALKEFERAISINQAHIKSYLNIAHMYIEADNPDRATDIFKTALEKNPHNEAILLELSNHYDNIGHNEAAKNMISSELEYAPGKSMLYFALGQLYLSEKNYDKAQTAFTKAIEKDPLLVESHARLAQAFLLTGKSNEAIEHYNSTLKLYPYHAQALLNRGKLYVILKNIKGAQRDLSRYIKVHEGNADAYYHLALTYILENKKDTAKKYLKEALTLDPSHKEAQTLLGQL